MKNEADDSVSVSTTNRVIRKLIEFFFYYTINMH